MSEKYSSNQKEVKLDYLLGATLYSVIQFCARDESKEESLINDSVVLETSKGLVQIINEYNSIIVIVVVDEQSFKVWDSFEGQEIKIVRRKVVRVLNQEPVYFTYEHRQDENYLFGIKLEDKNQAFIAALCLGFDEIECQDENSYKSLLNNYSNTREKRISPEG